MNRSGVNSASVAEPEQPEILPLPRSIVNRIAAGEVVERPAAVVKELVENAIDAGATGVTIEVEDGGRTLIRVSDDGRGIPPGQLPLAFAAHATSKIRSDAELDKVGTMGFRGEALASIGEVSRATITSRTAGDDAAWSLTNDGGSLGEVRPTSGNPGTSVEVRDLFFNTPARRKYVRHTGTESGHVTDAVHKIALPRPTLAVRYVRDGRVIFEWPAEDHERRLTRAWPNEYVGRSLTVGRDDRGYVLRGVVGLPELAATHGRYQHLFIDGRAIRDRGVAHALREAYRGLTEPGRQPAAVLMLELPPGEVDVNVHPTKAEVRFRESRRVHSLVLAGVRDALMAADLTPNLKPRVVAEEAGGGERPNVRETLAAFFSEKLDAEVRQTWLGEDEDFGGADGLTPAVPVAEPEVEQEAIQRRVQTDRPPATALQLHNSYLVVPEEDGMVIIDQHALHERILFEDILQRLRRGPLESQHLLMPLPFDADEGQLAALERLGPLLKKLGVEAEPLGPEAIGVQAFPSFLHRLDPVAFLSDVLSKPERELADAGDEELLHEVLDMMSCKAAVKAGDPLTSAEVDALLARRDLASRSSNCPHGRPTTLRLTLADLEKQFKRTGF